MTIKLALIGNAGSGKDTFAGKITNKYKIKSIALADPIYEIAKDLFQMKNKDRELLINIGETLRKIDENVFINYALRKLEKYEAILITDVRTMREFKALAKERFKFILIQCEPEERYRRIELRDKLELKEEDIKKMESNKTEKEVRDITKYMNEKDMEYETVYNGIGSIEKDIELQADRIARKFKLEER